MELFEIILFLLLALSEEPSLPSQLKSVQAAAIIVVVYLFSMQELRGRRICRGYCFCQIHIFLLENVSHLQSFVWGGRMCKHGAAEGF